MPDAKDIRIEKGKLELENVTFGYVKDRPVLTNVTFAVQPGEKIAILGATGSGKSSLIYLIPRFYDIQAGTIRIDGTDIREFKLASLRQQRITIARALVGNPKMLIMDDSLSFVDAKTEQEIQSAIEEATKTRTTLIIAQRFSTIKTAEKILVLENGSIAEFGTHEELIAKDGVYRKVYETQFVQKASPILEEACGS